MNIHCVAFILASEREIADGSAFEQASQFCKWDATVVIRCEQTGRDLQVHCPAGSVSNAARFHAEWIRKHKAV
jgi:hypothetical protein